MQITLAEGRLRSSVALEANPVRPRDDTLSTQLYRSIIYLPAHPGDPPVAPSASTPSGTRSTRPSTPSKIEF
jgi:hypothetical protein